MATQSNKKAAGNNKRKSGGGGGGSLKVVYISSPMKVRTSATRFRSLVQQLTGKNSDIARYMQYVDASAADFLDDAAVHETTTTTITPDTSTDSFLDDINALGFLSSEYSFPSQMDMYHGYKCDELLN